MKTFENVNQLREFLTTLPGDLPVVNNYGEELVVDDDPEMLKREAQFS